jgi:hypothetical protein
MTDEQVQQEDELDPAEVRETLGQLMQLGREQKKAIQEVSKVLTELKREHQEVLDQILSTMRTLGITSTKTDGVASVSITIRDDANVKDWDAFYEFIEQQNMPQLLQKRVMSAGYRELREQGVVIPGVEDYEHAVLNLKILN